MLPNQTGPKVVGGLWSMPAFWNNTLYIGGAGDNLHQFSFDPVAGKLWTPQAFADRSLIERRAGSAREVCRAHNCKRQGLRRHPQQAGGLRAAALAAISEERGPQSTTSGQGSGLA